MRMIEQALLHKDHVAVIANGSSYTYQELLNASHSIASVLLNWSSDLQEMRVAYMVEPGFDYVSTQWAIWRAGGIAVPLCLSHPPSSLQYVIEDARVGMVIASGKYLDVIKAVATAAGIPLFVSEDLEKGQFESALPVIDPERDAMILYTSGTTNKPKGVVTTHANIHAQIAALIEAWKWNSSDHILCVLPLHHVHGIINVVNTAMSAGATCEFLNSFSAKEVFEIFQKGQVNVFMAVPTIYFKLLAYWDELAPNEQEELKRCMQKFRLMVSGSAALPVGIMKKWEIVSGHTLLERYGMTEIGMAISNPYDGERKPGYVGIPLPNVQVKLANEQYESVSGDEPGEILLKGPNVFHSYWDRPEATKEAFTNDGWFKTGDIAVLENGYYRIMGRSSVDIIKSGGYKISALEIEEILRNYKGIVDCAVVGIDDEEWGELIVSAIVVSEDIDLEKLNKSLRTEMAHYKTPRRYLIVEELPRNAMGKVTKNDVKNLFLETKQATN